VAEFHKESASQHAELRTAVKQFVESDLKVT
jgi:hypothetical protein